MSDAVVELLPHPGGPPAPVRRVSVAVSRSPRGLLLCYRLEGDLAAIVLPPPAEARHTDGLWRHTCFEAFLRPAGGAAYDEFNFSPSGAWAAYRFAGRRLDGQALALPVAPAIHCTRDDTCLQLEAELDLAAADRFDGALEAGLAAVVEAQDGGLSYWALHHALARPDFHDPAGFTLALAPARPAPATETRP